MPNPNDDARSPWDMSQERQFIENLLCQRFNFFLLFFSIAIAGALNAKTPLSVSELLVVGTVICWMFYKVLRRTQSKLDLALAGIFSTESHPAAKINKDAGVEGSARLFVGKWIPLACCIFVTTCAIISMPPLFAASQTANPTTQPTVGVDNAALNTFQIAEAVAVILASGVAIWTFWIWRDQQTYTKRREVALKALSLAYEFVDTMHEVRSPGGWASEGKTRKRDEKESPEKSEALDKLFVPIERLNKHIELFRRMRVQLFDLMPEFGPDQKDAFKEAFDFRLDVHLKVDWLTSLLDDSYHRDDGEFARMRKELQLLQYERQGDATNQKFDAMVRRLEGLVRDTRKGS